MEVAVLALVSLPPRVIWITSTGECQAARADVFPHWLLLISEADFKRILGNGLVFFDDSLCGFLN